MLVRSEAPQQSCIRTQPAASTSDEIEIEMQLVLLPRLLSCFSIHPWLRKKCVWMVCIIMTTYIHIIVYCTTVISNYKPPSQTHAGATHLQKERGLKKKKDDSKMQALLLWCMNVLSMNLAVNGSFFLSANAKKPQKPSSTLTSASLERCQVAVVVIRSCWMGCKITEIWSPCDPDTVETIDSHRQKERCMWLLKSLRSGVGGGVGDGTGM